MWKKYKYRHRGKKDIAALEKALADSERMMEKEDDDHGRTGQTLKRILEKVLERRREEMELIEEAEEKALAKKRKKPGPYTHAEASVVHD